MLFASEVGLFHKVTLDEALSSNQNFTTECGPKFVVEHQNIHCLDEMSTANFKTPNVFSDCGKIVHLYNTDNYHTFGCESQGFAGWFKKDNWSQLKIKGDGGVDVTGAPNVLLVEGASKASVEVMPGSSFSLEILMPADGFITFDWSIIGGSNLMFAVRAGEKMIQHPDHFFSSPRLKAGESFSLLFQSTLDAPTIKFRLNDFNFFTDIVSFIERKWTAVDELGNRAEATQFVGIEGIQMNQIIMPVNVENTPSAYFAKGVPSPEVAGYPLFDEDTDPATEYDQTELRRSNCAVAVSWTDKIEQVENGRLVLREWKIGQECSSNVVIYTQKIRLYKHFNQIKDQSAGDEPQHSFNRNNLFENGRLKKNPYNFMSSRNSKGMN